MGIPYQQNLMELRTRLLSNPALMQQYMQQFGGGGGDGSGGAPGSLGKSVEAPGGQGVAAPGAQSSNDQGSVGAGNPLLGPLASNVPLDTSSVTPGKLPPTPELATVTAPGGAAFRVASNAAPAFQGLVNDLERAGYPIDAKTSGGFNPRMIAGTQTPSQHASGNAIDINWQANARGVNTPSDIPADVARSLAAKYGMVWGGDWTGNTRDPMHFEYRGGGKAPGSYQEASLTPTPPPGGGAQAAPAPSPPGATQTAQATPQTPQPPQQGGTASQAGPDPKAMATAQQYEQRASTIEFMRSLGVPAPGDPAGLRQAAQAWREFAFTGAKEAAKQQAELATAGPKAAATSQAELPASLTKLGYSQGADGRLTAIPGGPADPARLGAVKAAEKNAELPATLAAEGWMPNAEGSGYVPIPGGKQDPRTIQQQTAAKASGENVDIRQGGLARVMNADGTFSYVKNPQLEKVQLKDGTERYAHISPPAPGSPPGTQGETTYVVDASGKPVDAKITPMQEAFLKTRGVHLAEQQDKIDADAAGAKESNYLFDNLRRDSQTWDMGKFADIEGEARAYLSAFAQAAGIDTPGLNEKLADYQAFGKSSGMLLRTAVHDTSSRAAVQEYSMIGKTLPQPTTSKQGFSQIADQWQGLSDFRVAKQQFARGYQGNPQDFNTDFNTKVSPTSFMLNRMEQSPEGHADAQAMLARMQATPEGKLLARRMLQQYQYAKTNGMFGELPAEQAP